MSGALPVVCLDVQVRRTNQEIALRSITWQVWPGLVHKDMNIFCG
ncbi:hypothetical protein R69658_03274 [Paraburkholderia aspalathi]|jgi:hypothetical protein|uniref:Uncharacterized protein n=1 Tax=Paraburkholderia aspalathi TaxID=1324617 RepID=A0A1I6YYZ0_9BURK|nr:hypothetical protein [Paraburkholderia sediminicola]CAE6763462.1 hypothetical protein R69658_03274 [Paraburkholderia aspalathi]CAE6802881.1 hypothetical protein R20943_05323 [Paraburkholderia aspalathi]SFT55664.1 hypothetical protein SAMN05192563_100244 [Paraburkholderia aspalathi]